MPYLLMRDEKSNVLCGTESLKGVLNDVDRRLRDDEMLGDKPVSDWPMGITNVSNDIAREFLHQPFAHRTTPRVGGSTSGGIQYKTNHVVAYMDANGKPCTPHSATFAKVWDFLKNRVVLLYRAREQS